MKDDRLPFRVHYKAARRVVSKRGLGLRAFRGRWAKRPREIERGWQQALRGGDEEEEGAEGS